MAKVTYHAPLGDEAVVTIGGLRFFDDQAQEVGAGEHAQLLRKLATNPHFEVDGFDLGLPAAGSVDGAGSADDEAVIGLRAIHNGGGRFIIVRGDKDRKVKDGLNKADADAFNALSDDDKEQYVAA